MKKKNIFKILFIALVITFMPKAVFASSCDLAGQTSNPTLSEGTYTCTISEDITIDQPYYITGGTITISLDHNITSTSSSVFQVSGNANVIITGTGTASVTNSGGTVVNFQSSGELTITSGNLTGGRSAIDISKGSETSAASNVHIKNGTLTGKDAAVRIINPIGNLTIDGGTFTSSNGNGLSIFGGDEVIINEGTFQGNFSGAYFNSINTLRINGGTFKGEKYGIHLSSIENRNTNYNEKLITDGVLLGGTFQGTGDNSHAIGIISVEGDNDIFNTLVGNSHHYSKKFTAVREDIEGYGSAAEGPESDNEPEVEYLKSYMYVADINEVSVVEGSPTAEQKIEQAVVADKKEATKAEENPKTGSMLYIYIIAFLLVCGTALTVTYKRQKNNKEGNNKEVSQ